MFNLLNMALAAEKGELDKWLEKSAEEKKAESDKIEKAADALLDGKAG